MPLPPSPLENATPRVSDGARHRLELGSLALEIDAGDGARVVEFSLDGHNVLATTRDSLAAYGSSFWPSPQSDWNWPPPAELDRLPWRSGERGSALFFESETVPALGLAARALVSLDARHGGARFDYELENRGNAPRRVAPWQNSRVRARGLTFYPARGPTLPGSTLELELRDGVAWLAHDPARMKEKQKSFADGAEGWLAHLAGDLLFVKVFEEVPRAEQAPGEASIELYVDDSGDFVEVEQQGPYRELAPGAASRWRVAWGLERVAIADPTGAGAERLSQTARRLARRLLPLVTD